LALFYYIGTKKLKIKLGYKRLKKLLGSGTFFKMSRRRIREARVVQI